MRVHGRGTRLKPLSESGSGGHEIIEISMRRSIKRDLTLLVEYYYYVSSFAWKEAGAKLKYDPHGVFVVSFQAEPKRNYYRITEVVLNKTNTSLFFGFGSPFRLRP